MSNEKSTRAIVKLNPNNNLTIPMDKVFKNAFNPMKDSTGRKIVEDERNGEKIFTTLEFKNFNHFDKFDELVFTAAISEYRAGNDVFTIRRLWQKIGGGYNLPREMKNRISDSIERLACCRVKINATAANEKFHYCDKSEVIFRNYLLPCKSVEVHLNGRQVIDGAYQILDDSPLFQVSELKGQFAEQPVKLLDVPKLHNSELVLKLKFFLLERITAIIGSHKKHKSHIVGKKKGGGFIYKRATKLHKIITFEDIFEQCELSDATRWQKQDVRKTIEKVMEHFRAEKFISEWHFEKKNGAFYSIHFA